MASAAAPEKPRGDEMGGVVGVVTVGIVLVAMVVTGVLNGVVVGVLVTGWGGGSEQPANSIAARTRTARLKQGRLGAIHLDHCR